MFSCARAQCPAGGLAAWDQARSLKRITALRIFWLIGDRFTETFLAEFGRRGFRSRGHYSFKNLTTKLTK